MIADEIVSNARAIHQGTGTLSEATISALSRGSSPDPLRAAERALRLVLNQTETDLSASPASIYPVPHPRPASEP